MLVLTFQVGDEAMGVDIRRVREVVPRVCLRAVGGQPGWMAGVFVYRGMVVPTIDLHRLAGGAECPPHLSSRIILVPHPTPDGGERLLGLLATQVADIRTISADAARNPDPPADGATGFGSVVADGAGVLRLLEPDRLLPADTMRHLLALTAGAGP
jgi:chemotaxis-related protein WspB